MFLEPKCLLQLPRAHMSIWSIRGAGCVISVGVDVSPGYSKGQWLTAEQITSDAVIYAQNASKSPTHKHAYCPHRGVTPISSDGVPWKTSLRSRILPQQFRLDDCRRRILCPFKTAPGSPASSLLNALGSLYFCLSLCLQHPFPWRSHTWRIRRGERARDSASASAAALGWLRCVTKEREWETGGGRSEDHRDKQEGGCGRVQSASLKRRENGGATVSGMLGGGDDLSISIIGSHEAQTHIREGWWLGGMHDNRFRDKYRWESETRGL